MWETWIGPSGGEGDGVTISHRRLRSHPKSPSAPLNQTRAVRKRSFIQVQLPHCNDGAMSTSIARSWWSNPHQRCAQGAKKKNASRDSGVEIAEGEVAGSSERVINSSLPYLHCSHPLRLLTSPLESPLLALLPVGGSVAQ
jgi:hypothetical protein